MSRIRHAMLAAAAVSGLITATSAATAANAAPPIAANDYDCAKLVYQGHGWAAIHNKCGHGISATVDLYHHDNPHCVWVGPHGTSYITFHTHTWAKYAYEC